MTTSIKVKQARKIKGVDASVSCVGFVWVRVSDPDRPGEAHNRKSGDCLPLPKILKSSSPFLSFIIR